MGCASGRPRDVAPRSAPAAYALPHTTPGPRGTAWSVASPEAGWVASSPPAPARHSPAHRVTSHATLSPSGGASFRLLDAGEGLAGAARCVSETYAGDAAAVIALAKRAREAFCRCAFACGLCVCACAPRCDGLTCVTSIFCICIFVFVCCVLERSAAAVFARANVCESVCVWYACTRVYASALVRLCARACVGMYLCACLGRSRMHSRMFMCLRVVRRATFASTTATPFTRMTRAARGTCGASRICGRDGRAPAAAAGRPRPEPPRPLQATTRAARRRAPRRRARASTARSPSCPRRLRTSRARLRLATRSVRASGGDAPRAVCGDRKKV
jgi:hypothetical protein